MPINDRSKAEELRAKYMRVVFFPEQAGQEELRRRQIVDMMRVLGYPKNRIKRIEENLAKNATSTRP